MYSCLVARVESEDDYDMFTYQGPTLDIPFRGLVMAMHKGQRFGVRNAGGKQIRMIFAGDPTRVMALDLKLAKRIARGIKGA